MIKNIIPGTGITVTNDFASWPSFYNSPSGNSLVGQMRYNGSNQCIEVYDGHNWLMMGTGHPTVELAPHVQAVVAWAQVKMAEEARINELAAKHPIVADALEGLKKAYERVDVVAALCEVK
jgi:hypothetical protein